MDPAITPERFQEIEAKLLAAAAAPSPQQQKPVMSHTLSVPARGP
jgi:hypothetical protein